MSVFDRACHLALLCLPLIPSVSGQSYTVTDLGTLSGGSLSVAESINAASHVTGYAVTANGNYHPFLWTPGAGMIDIAGSAIPTGNDVQGFWINNNDHIVGSPAGIFEQGISQAFFYNGALSYLSGALHSSAYGINDSDQIAGDLGVGLGVRAVVWATPTALPLDISAIVAGACGISPTGNSDAGHMNNGGLVTGYSSSTSADPHAFLYNIQTNQASCLPNPGPLSVSYGINNIGQVIVGYFDRFDSSSTFQSALIWSPNKPPIAIPTLNNFTHVFAGIINDSGQVVGTLCTTCSNDLHAFLFSGGTTYDLNNLIPPGSGWVLQGAQGINNAGSIVGYGLHNGQMHGFLLIPTKPLVIVVPGIGASTLNGSYNGVDQWLSCASINSLHNGLVDPLGSLASLQYDINGNPNPATPLSPREILTQTDSISDIGKAPTQSIFECSNNPPSGVDASILINDVVCTSIGPIACSPFQILPPGEPTVGLVQESMLSSSSGTLLQFNDPSNSLLGTLASNGFNPQPWPYDFRKDISGLANDLYNEITKVSENNPGRPIAIIAHSEGSIVTAAMIAQHPDVYPTFLNKVVSIGAPFLGAIDTYLYAQGWEAFVDFMSTSNTALLGQNWTSVYELLPQWSFFTPLSGPSPSVSEIVNGLQSFNWPSLPRPGALPDPDDRSSVLGEINALTANVFPNWYAFIGHGYVTNRQIVQSLADAALGFVFSKPCFSLQKDDGDGTVTAYSAEGGTVVPPSNMIFVNERHAMLPKNGSVLAGIVNILNGTSPFAVSGLVPQSEVPSFIPQDTLTVNACSPVAVSVTNSSGEKINSQVSEIQNATYQNITDATQIDLPWNDVFKTDITGTGNGTFDLVVNGTGGQHSPLGYIFRAVPVLKGSQGSVLVGGDSIPTLQYNYTEKNVIDQIPANVTPPTIVCTGGYFIIQNARATFAFNVGYPGGVSTFSYNYRTVSQTVQFVSTVTSEISISGNTASFSGQGTLDGGAGYGFSVVATDGGGPGSGLDSVAVTITGPNGYSYSANAAVVGGDVIVHP